MALRWQQQNVNQTSNSQQTSHNSPSQASYGVSSMSILKKIDLVITAPHCIVLHSSNPSKVRPTTTTQIAKFMGPTWGSPGSCWPQIGPMLAPWTLLSGNLTQVFPVPLPLRWWYHEHEAHNNILPYTIFLWKQFLIHQQFTYVIQIGSNAALNTIYLWKEFLYASNFHILFPTAANPAIPA